MLFTAEMILIIHQSDFSTSTVTLVRSVLMVMGT